MARTVPGTLVRHSGRLLESGDMAVERLRSGDRSGPYDLVLNADMAAALATATLDHTPSYFDGTALPPTAIATQTYAPQMAAIFELVPEAVFAAAHGGVHGRHDLVLHRAIRPGEELHSLVEMHSARTSKDNLRVTLLHRTYDALERLVAEQWWTTVLLGTSADETGPELPAHGGIDCAPEQAIGEEVVRLDADMVRRYADLSGDFSDHHFDVEAARRSGFAGPFLHGLCTMALCARAVVATVCPDDPSRLQRLALQFASPAYLDRDLTVQVRSLGGEDRFAFEATCGDDVVIRSGFAELRSSI
jgi:acyl dehydratase